MTGVMTNIVQIKFRPRNIIEVQLSREDTLSAPQLTCKHLAKRIDDDASTGNHDIFRSTVAWVGDGMVRRVIFFFCVLTSRKDEATALEGDVGHRTLPNWTRVYSRCAIELGAFRVVEGADYSDDRDQPS